MLVIARHMTKSFGYNQPMSVSTFHLIKVSLMKNCLWSALALAAVLVAPLTLNAQEKGGKRNPSTALVTQLMKNLEKAELTADQTTKIKEMFGKVATEVAAKRATGGLTADVLKKRLEAGKAAKEAGKKGKDLQAAISGAVALTPEQAKALEETEAMLSKARVEIGKLLTPEQLAKLPEQARNSFKEKAAGKKGKKKN
jgi:hypothetical protein